MTRFGMLVAGLAVVAAHGTAVAQVVGTVTVLYDDRVIEVAETLADPNDLWVRPADLPQ